MEQFNLDKYLKNPNRKVVTRDGKSARIICTNRLDSRYPVVAFIRLGDDYEDIWDFTKDGKSGEHGTNNYDLFFAPEKKEGWVNIYYCAQAMCGLIHESEERAKQEIDKDKLYIATVKIEWEE